MATVAICGRIGGRQRMRSICTIDGCDGFVRGRGLCAAHYEKDRRQRLVPDPNVKCVADGCNKPALHRSLCGAHYSRLRRYGDPLGSKRRKKTEPVTFIESAVERDTDTCLIWPYGAFDSGYGYIHVSGRMLRAHRVVCERVHGPAPDGVEVAHSCGVRACVNPRHLRWATPRENAADKILHGTHLSGERMAQAKLTAESVRVIRTSRVRQKDLAQKFGVTQAVISAVRLRKIWKHVHE